MAIEAETLLALSEKASQGEWLLRGRFISAPSTNPSIPGQDVVVSTGYSDRRVEEDEANVAFIAALVSAYRDGSLIHRSALAEDTARAAEGTAGMDEAVALFRRTLPHWTAYKVEVKSWRRMTRFYVEISRLAVSGEEDIESYFDGGATPVEAMTRTLALVPEASRLPIDKEAADANR